MRNLMATKIHKW